MKYDYLYVPFEDNRLETETGCIEALYQAKWPHGFVCPRCSHRLAYVISTRRLPLYECMACRAQTSLTAGTIMEGSRTTLRRWFMAMHLLAQPRSVNAVQLADIIGVTYKTAWLICHKIRQAMIAAETTEPLTGQVRMTDMLIRSLPVQSNGMFQPQEQVVMIGASDNEQGQAGRIKLQLHPKAQLNDRYSSPLPESFMRLHVEPNAAMLAAVIPRRSRGPDKQRLQELRHDLFLIGKDLELWLSRVFGGIKPKHLQRYLFHFGYRWNRQSEWVFAGLLQSCAATMVITYPMLTKSAARPQRFAVSREIAPQYAA